MWHTKKLNEVCDIQSGLWKGKKGPYTTALVLRNTNFTASGVFDYSNVVELEVEAKQLAKREVIKNDIILEKSGGGDKTPVGRVCIHDKESKIPFSLSNFTARIRVLDSKELNAKFLHKFLYFLYISGKTEPMQRHSTGIRNLQLTQYKDIDVPLPPLAEQQRIVAKLDAAFAEIDEAVEATSESLKSIQQLFLTSLASLVNADDLGESKPLGEICELAQGLAINKGTKHLLVENSSKPLIRIKDLINETEEQYINDEYENKKTEVNEEDLIFTRTGSLGLVFRGRKGVLHNNSFKVSPNKALSRDYLYWWLKNPSFLNNIHRISGKAAQPDISHKLFKAQQIKIPTAVKQKDIVAKIELLFEQTEKMKRINLHKLHQIRALKLATLSQELQSSEAA